MPIITSLLDIDFYKFTMGQIVFHRYPDVPVRYAFKNRTSKVRLADFVSEDDLRQELDHVRTLGLNNTELHYLRGTNEYGDRMFAEDYLKFLVNFRLPAYHLEVADGIFTLEFSGKWSEAIYWETIALSVVNELYYRAKMAQLSRFGQDNVYAVGKCLLGEKIIRIRANPDIRFSDFGTRRRFSREWQDYQVGVLKEEIPAQFLGTSNVSLAMKHGVAPMGTSAHERDMAMAAILQSRGESIRGAQNIVLEDWWAEYGWGLSIALTDTWGTDFFFTAMTEKQARLWKGLRQDSGDPFEFAEKAIRFYIGHDINPREKLLIFSDGLDIETIVKLQSRFSRRINVGFGWGTNLTNDLGFKPLSLVVKLVEANGRGAVKLSDNLAKAVGKPEDIEHYKKELGYTGNTFDECRY
ncbi:MAG: nicotinate phosphoribosyltransferase [Candidatus Spechtbacterales bacterium]